MLSKREALLSHFTDVATKAQKGVEVDLPKLKQQKSGRARIEIQVCKQLCSAGNHIYYLIRNY